MLAISRSFHYYWQPAPRWRLLPWLANPGKPASHEQAPVALHEQWKRGREVCVGGGGGGWGSLEDEFLLTPTLIKP